MIAAVNGLTLGGGSELALSCGIRLVSEYPDTVSPSIVSKGHSVVRLAREAVCNGRQMDLGVANPYATKLFGLCFASSDQKQRMQALLEKRPPHFLGNESGSTPSTEEETDYDFRTDR